MAKDPMDTSRNDDNGEEFHFTELNEESEEKASETNSSSTSTHSANSYVSSVKEGKSLAEIRRNKLIFMAIGLIIALFCIYKLYGLFTATSAHKTTNVSTIPSAQTKKQATNGSSAISSLSTPAFEEANTNTTASTSQPALELSASTGNSNDKVAVLEDEVSKTVQSQQDLQNQIAELSSAITEIQSNLSALTEQINTLAAQKKEEPQKASADSTKAATAVVPKKRSYKPKPKVVYTQYYIKAVIQGRAWLITPNGATFTVSEGDQLPGYGEVMNIDTENGAVMTSSGRIINFMPQDR